MIKVDLIIVFLDIIMNDLSIMDWLDIIIFKDLMLFI